MTGADSPSTVNGCRVPPGSRARALSYDMLLHHIMLYYMMLYFAGALGRLPRCRCQVVHVGVYHGEHEGLPRDAHAIWAARWAPYIPDTITITLSSNMRIDMSRHKRRDVRDKSIETKLAPSEPAPPTAAARPCGRSDCARRCSRPWCLTAAPSMRRPSSSVFCLLLVIIIIVVT